MHTAYINIGSNLGDRLSIVESAAAAIERELHTTARRAPAVISEPWGYESSNPYLNLGIAVDTPLSPLELHESLQRLQHAIDPAPHRDADGGYIDRRIDIDLIAVDTLVIDTPRLTLPHPRMHLRRFVLEPMAFLAPHWHHPLLGLTSTQLLARLS